MQVYIWSKDYPEYEERIQAMSERVSTAFAIAEHFALVPI